MDILLVNFKCPEDYYATVVTIKNPLVGYIDNAMKWRDVPVVWENFCCWDEYVEKHKVINVINRSSVKGKKYVQINNKNTRMSVFIVHFAHISHLFLMLLFVALNK